MNSDSALGAGLLTDEQVFRNFLSAYSLIDIGTIQYVSGNIATVATSIFMQGKQIIYENAEVIYPGNDQGVFGAASANCPCLIFIPRSCMPNIRDKKVKHAEATYSKNGIKVMPIGNGTNNNVYTRYDDNGNLNIFTKSYILTFDDNGVSLQRKDTTASMTLNENGDLYVAKRGVNGAYRVVLEDGIVQSTWISKDEDVQWTDTLNSDGSRSFVQANPQDEEADPLFSFTIAADGSVSFTLAQDISLTTNGTLTLQGASVAISATGTEDGQGNVTIDSATDKQVQVNGTNLTVDK